MPETQNSKFFGKINQNAAKFLLILTEIFMPKKRHEKNSGRKARRKSRARRLKGTNAQRQENYLAIHEGTRARDLANSLMDEPQLKSTEEGGIADRLSHFTIV